MSFDFNLYPFKEWTGGSDKAKRSELEVREDFFDIDPQEQESEIWRVVSELVDSIRPEDNDSKG